MSELVLPSKFPGSGLRAISTPAFSGGWRRGELTESNTEFHPASKYNPREIPGYHLRVYEADFPWVYQPARTLLGNRYHKQQILYMP